MMRDSQAWARGQPWGPVNAGSLGEESIPVGLAPKPVAVAADESHLVVAVLIGHDDNLCPSPSVTHGLRVWCNDH